jgi:subtilisin family serine protease
MWNLQKIRWDEGRALPNFKEANEVEVAVLDTGVDLDHPDLESRVSNYVFDHPHFAGTSSDQDIVGHGTHVAGSIAADNTNNLGVDGICNCRLKIWKIFDDIPDLVRGGAFSQSKFVYFVDPAMYQRALADCLDEDVDVINLSIGGPGLPDQNELQLFSDLLDNGTTIVAAMGNQRRAGSPTSYPAAIPGVIAVGATNIDDTVANFSNRGNHISLCAPGVGPNSPPFVVPATPGYRASRYSAKLTTMPGTARPWPRPTSPLQPRCSLPRASIRRMYHAYVADDTDIEETVKHLSILPEIESADVPAKRCLVK